MTKRRMIHDCIWQSEHFTDLTMQQRLLWIGLITTADDQGRGRAHPGLVRAAIFPFDVIAQDDIQTDIEVLCGTGLLILYEVECKRYYQVVKWWEYQTPAWASPSEYPAPEGWEDRFRYHSAGRVLIKSPNWSEDNSLRSPLRSRKGRPQEEEEEEEEEEVKEKEQENDGANAPTASPSSSPSSFPEWLTLLKDTSNKAGTLGFMYQTLYKQKPDYKRLAALAKKAGGASALATILWNNATRALVNPIDYLTKIVNNGNGRDGNNGSKPSASTRPPGLSEDDWVALQYVQYNHDDDAKQYRAELEAKGVKVDEWLSTIS